MKKRWLGKKSAAKFQFDGLMKWPLIGMCLLCSCDFESSGRRQPGHDHGGIQVPPPRTVSSKWSNPQTWPNGKVPVAGQTVVLPKGKRILLDVSTASLGGLEIPMGSALQFDRKNLKLTSEWIMVNGELRIGSEQEPFKQKAEIELTNKTPGEDISDMGDRVLGVMGHLELHGHKHVSWTRLSKTAVAGSTTLHLEKAPDWKSGHVLTLASTDFSERQTEEVTIKSINGRQVTLNTPLKYPHFVQNVQMGGKTIKHTAEVGLLTRNIRIFAGKDADKSGFGAHSMVMGKGEARVEGVEFNRVGQRNLLRRYPFHYHLIGDASQSYFRNNSIHNTYNRCISIHGTSKLRFENNVTYNSLGHCVFLEDGNEIENSITGNLVTLVRRPDQKKGEKPLLDSDKRAAAYWISHPKNIVAHNVSVGARVGFWLAFPKNPTGLAKVTGKNIWNRRTPLGKFDSNVAHSGGTGLDVDHGPNSGGSKTETSYYKPLSDPANKKSNPVPATFSHFTAYKMRERGAWLRGENLTLHNAILTDNAIGVTLASHKSKVQDTLIVGETANIGQPASWEPVGHKGRSLPRPGNKEFPIRGYEFYDGLVGAENIKIAGFKSTTQRKASGLGTLVNNGFPMDPQNYVKKITWLDDSQRVYFHPANPKRDGDQTSIFKDVDGSVTGAAGRYITANPLLMNGKGCQKRAEWRAAVCTGEFGRVWLENKASNSVGPLKVHDTKGAQIKLVGAPGGWKAYSTSIRLNETYTVNLAAQSTHLRIGLTDTKPGAVVKLVIPMNGDRILYRDWWIDERNRLKKVAASQLDTTDGDSYAYEGGQLFLKMKIKETGKSGVLDICSQPLCK